MKLNLTGGSTSITLLVFIQDSSSATGAGLTGLVFNSAGLTAYYARPGAATAAITLATQTVNGAYSSGGFVEVDATNMPGVYRFDIPDAAIAAGVTSVVAMLKGAANMAPLLLEIQLTPAPANLTQIDGQATNGNNATLSLAQLNIVNSAGSAIVASSTGGNGHGIAASGNGSGEGISATGGTTGNGVQANGRAGIVAQGFVVEGISVVGQTHGISTTSATNGHGVYARGGSTGGNGILAEGQAGNGHGLRAAGQGSGEGISAVGGTTGHGIEATGGATSGNGINAAASAGNGHGLNVAGQGSGHGLNATGGATGNGIDANGGATSGDGINAAATDGDGMSLAGAGAGVDLDATTTDSLQVDVIAISSDAAAAVNAEAFFDGTGYAGTNNTIPTVTNVTNQVTANATAISGSATAADRAESIFLSLVVGAAQTGTLSTTQMSTNLTEATNDHYNGRLLTWVTGNLAGQQTDITDYDGTSKTLTFTAVTEAPADGDAFVIS